jgi:hypothetical protein
MSPSSVLIREIRQLLQSDEFAAEDVRKAAVREALRAAVTGLKEEEIVAFVAELRQRFPDRVYEAAAAARRFQQSFQELEREVARLQGICERLEHRVHAQDVLLERICAAVREVSRHETPGPAVGAAGGPSESPDPELLGPLMEAAALLFAFAVAQDESARIVEDHMGWSGRSRSAPFAELFDRLLHPVGTGAPELSELRRRRTALQLLPAALMTAAEQSWRSGTQEVLEALDPKAIEEGIQTRLPGRRDAAAFKELRRRHEQFWGQLEKNIDHYYRSKFKRIYTEKMEGGS